MGRSARCLFGQSEMRKTTYVQVKEARGDVQAF